jgi:DnaK suppressor protein
MVRTEGVLEPFSATRQDEVRGMAPNTGSIDQDRNAQIGARLRERANQLREEIRATLARSNDETHVRVAEAARDEGDDSFSDLIADLNFADIDRDALELQRIDGALVRLKDGTYGTCIDCDQPIAKARLEAEPTAVRCITCQERYEQTHATQNTPTL